MNFLSDFFSVLSSVSDEGTLLIAIYIAYLAGGFKNQLYNHIPTQIRELEKKQSIQNKELEKRQNIQIEELKENQKEIKNDIKEQNQKIDQHFKELVRLISKQSTS